MDKIGFELPGRPGTFRIAEGQLHLFRPHRYPMVILEDVTECCLAEKWLIGSKKVRPDDLYVQAHFPGDCFMPASFVVEALAQASGCLMNLVFYYDRGVKLWELASSQLNNLEQPPYNVLAEAKIRQLDLAWPGETLSLHAKVALQRKDIIAFHTEAKVIDRVIAQGEVMLAYPPYTPVVQVSQRQAETTNAAS